MKTSASVIKDERWVSWLLDGAVSIQYQTHRDLLDEERPDLRSRIAREGWGRRLLSLQREDGHWGKGFYQPKWTSTHYTLLARIKKQRSGDRWNLQAKNPGQTHFDMERAGRPSRWNTLRALRILRKFSKAF